MIIPIAQLPVYVGKSYCHSVPRALTRKTLGRLTYASIPFGLGNWSRDAKGYEPSGEKLPIKLRSLEVLAVTKVVN